MEPIPTGREDVIPFITLLIVVMLVVDGETIFLELKNSEMVLCLWENVGEQVTSVFCLEFVHGTVLFLPSEVFDVGLPFEAVVCDVVIEFMDDVIIFIVKRLMI